MDTSRIVVAAALCAALVASAAPANAAGLMAGSGTASRSPCPPGTIAVSGVHVSGSEWIFSATYQNASTGSCTFTGSATVQGIRDANGCIDGVGGRVCVTTLPPPGGTVTSPVVLCVPLGNCYTGSAGLTRAGTG